MDIKQALTEFAKIIEEKLERYWQVEIDQNFGFNQKQKDLVKKVLGHLKEHGLRKGKRLRAALVYYGYLLGQNNPTEIDEKIFNAALAVELVHTGLLIHDDFMDQDEKRRGLPTTHSYFANGDQHYGDSMAVTVGDVILPLGYKLIINSSSKPELVVKAMTQMLEAIAQTACGQAFDITLEKDWQNWQEDDVLALHQTKTALYTYDNPLTIGAILGGLNQAVLNILHGYSINAGIAFQLQDDILGIFGDPEKTGKSANSDLLQGKSTLLIIKALNLGQPAEKEAILKVWGKKQGSEEDILRAKEAIKNSGSLTYSQNLAKEYAQKAITELERINQFNLNETAIDFLRNIAQYMINREM